MRQKNRKKAAIYGLGIETEKALPELDKQYEIVGLLDSFREEGELYGKKIISLDEAKRLGVRHILVVARPGSCRAIAAKIGGFCREQGIALFDMEENDLLARKRVLYDFTGQRGVTREAVFFEAERHDAVSFDLFDTLVMRQTLYPEDVAELVSQKLSSCGILIENFCSKRLNAEKELSKNNAPTLEEIYASFSDVGVSPERLAQIEFSVDLELVVPRNDVVSLLADVHKMGKKIYITTDTYYSRPQIEELLGKAGITQYDGLLISSEEKRSKRMDLFSILKDKEKKCSFLHIGDDPEADIQCAYDSGISAVKLCSSSELLELSGFLGLDCELKEFASRMKIGMFIANLLNSPFQFEKEPLCVSTAYDIGYLFFAPLLSDFVFWLQRKIKEKETKNIWFTARDGYLFQKLYDLLEPGNTSTYFLTSRIAAIRAGVEKEEDLYYISDMKFTGTLSQQLKTQFGLETGRIEEEKSLFDYADQILERAKNSRKHYDRYIDRLCLNDGDIVFTDFVAKGTTQLFVSRLIPNKLRGLYFLQLDKEYMAEKNLNIEAFCDDKTLYDDYYILETVLMSPDPSVVDFGEQGEPVYAGEVRSPEELECLREIQSGVLDYFKKAIMFYNGQMEIKTDTALLELVHKVRITERRFEALRVEDIFFNRTTSFHSLI